MKQALKLKHLSNPAIHRLKLVVFLACLIPLARLAVADLGADPVDTLTRSTGRWALNFLFISLAITPLRKFTGWLWLVRLRRTVALYSFFYACLHLGVYVVFDQFFDWAAIVRDIAKRPYITAGFFSFVLLVPLAITSTNGMIRRLGGRRWQHLHRLVYLIAISGVFHYLWLVKRDITGPAWYALILCGLLSARMLTRPRVRTGALDKGSMSSTIGVSGGTSMMVERGRE